MADPAEIQKKAKKKWRELESPVSPLAPKPATQPKEALRAKLANLESGSYAVPVAPKDPMQAVVGHELPFKWVLSHELALDEDFRFDPEAPGVPEGPAAESVKLFNKVLKKVRMEDMRRALEDLAPRAGHSPREGDSPEQAEIKARLAQSDRRDPGSNGLQRTSLPSISVPSPTRYESRSPTDRPAPDTETSSETDRSPRKPSPTMLPPP